MHDHVIHPILLIGCTNGKVKSKGRRNRGTILTILNDIKEAKIANGAVRRTLDRFAFYFVVLYSEFCIAADAIVGRARAARFGQIQDPSSAVRIANAQIKGHGWAAAWSRSRRSRYARHVLQLSQKLALGRDDGPEHTLEWLY